MHDDVGADACLPLRAIVQHAQRKPDDQQDQRHFQAMATMLISDRIGRCTRLATIILFIMRFER